MVSLGTITKLGSLAIAGFLGYTLLKNAGSIGSSVGSFAGTGLRNLGSGISDGFTTAFDIFGGNVNANTAGAVSQDDPNIDMGTNPEDVNVPSAGTTPIAQGFSSFVESGAVSRGFAESYSFQPPASSGQLDVSKTFAYLSSTDYRTNQLKQLQTRGDLGLPTSGDFGGYGSASGQTEALAQAIEQSAKNYPEWFA
jgi:hypothetical protein